MEEHANKFHFNRLQLGESFSILTASKFFSSQYSFTYLILRSICGTENSSQQTSLQCLSTINMVFTDKDMISIEILFEISMGKVSLF